jgi:hypothetical protein
MRAMIRGRLIGALGLAACLVSILLFVIVCIIAYRSGCDITSCKWFARLVATSVRVMIACSVVSVFGIIFDRNKTMAITTLIASILSLMVMGVMVTNA